MSPHAAAGRLHGTRSFSIPGFRSHYPLTIYLPPGYHSSDRHYPVAYMFDGQNLFGDRGSFSGGWHLHQALDARARKGKLVPIVVGLHHGGASRMEELSPWPIWRRSKGRGDNLLQWVMGTLAGMIKEDLRILHGPANTMIGGSSLGGLMALYGCTSYPDFFGQALCMSPSLWVHGGAIYRHVAHSQIHPGTRIYLDMGGREGGRYALYQGRVMSEFLEYKGLVSGQDFMWRPDSKGSHNERNWRRRLPKALRFLYG